MRTAATNIDNDIFLADDGNLAMARGVAAIAETAEHYAAAARAEMIHKMDEGLPFFQTVFARDASLPQFEAALRRRLLQAPGVQAVMFLDTAQDGDVLQYTATLLTDLGEVDING